MLQSDDSAFMRGVFDVTAELAVDPGLDAGALAAHTNLVPFVRLKKGAGAFYEGIDFRRLLDGIHPSHADIEDPAAADIRDLALESLRQAGALWQ